VSIYFKKKYLQSGYNRLQLEIVIVMQINYKFLWNEGLKWEQKLVNKKWKQGRYLLNG
jgi:hypothetical protein